ncbi:MAG: DUF177 domain-containing protein [Anaerolineae bacterium]|nr:DUF177 domain-containing protein [Anaerolineae bacterium]
MAGLGFFINMLQFDLSPLIGARPGERLVFSLSEGPHWLEDVQVAFLRGPVTFVRVQGGILVEARLETSIEVECVRCLDRFSHAAVLEVEETIGLAGHSQPEIVYHLTEEGWFDPLPLFREQVWVVLPMKALCRLDCKGYCPECGSNLNVEACSCRKEQVDPRLASLAAFYDRRQEE